MSFKKTLPFDRQGLFHMSVILSKILGQNAQALLSVSARPSDIFCSDTVRSPRSFLFLPRNAVSMNQKNCPGIGKR